MPVVPQFPYERKMDQPVEQHIADLERRVQCLGQEIMRTPKTLSERNRLEAELRVAQQALAYYQHTIKLEKQRQRQ